ncbi:hypothetical protein BU16DRAFT_306581 [Lophium mytilinum]|uniref:Uncharacterized protein n=1 Tax=Lophium mytilinum TaxID=390894 RepID=A0A6A6R256_9PEZI|nr:hypothetical protein BU16DRAFT_306581 [Lophium mytilinum]
MVRRVGMWAKAEDKRRRFVASRDGRVIRAAGVGKKGAIEHEDDAQTAKLGARSGRKSSVESRATGKLRCGAANRALTATAATLVTLQGRSEGWTRETQLGQWKAALSLNAPRRRPGGRQDERQQGGERRRTVEEARALRVSTRRSAAARKASERRLDGLPVCIDGEECRFPASTKSQGGPAAVGLSVGRVPAAFRLRIRPNPCRKPCRAPTVLPSVFVCFKTMPAMASDHGNTLQNALAMGPPVAHLHGLAIHQIGLPISRRLPCHTRLIGLASPASTRQPSL